MQHIANDKKSKNNAIILIPEVSYVLGMTLGCSGFNTIVRMVN